jgi:hypothetical protein
MICSSVDLLVLMYEILLKTGPLLPVLGTAGWAQVASTEYRMNQYQSKAVRLLDRYNKGRKGQMIDYSSILDIPFR